MSGKKSVARPTQLTQPTTTALRFGNIDVNQLRITLGLMPGYKVLPNRICFELYK
jgi:hypothetical protein